MIAAAGRLILAPMYAQHFGLKQAPFSIAPDPRYLYMSERHREALAHLLYGVRGEGGFVVLTGEIGAGKTTVCRCFLEQVPERCNVAYIFNPKLTVDELLRTVCAEFHIAAPHHGPGTATVKDHVDALNEYLLRTHAAGQNSVLIIDEAQNLSADVLEQLRLLTNLETIERKLLQIVLIGQPELRTLLARPEMQQLAQRVIARYHLEALAEGETVQYVGHRMAIAGLTGEVPFDRAAMQRVYRHSRGVPRRINLLCDRALLGAYSQGRSRVDAGIVDAAAKEVFDVPVRAENERSGLRPAALVGLGIVAGATAVAVALFVLDRDGRGVAKVDAAVVAGAAPAAALVASPGTAPVAEAPRETAPAVPADAPAATAAAERATVASDAKAGSVEPAPFDLAAGFESLVGAENAAWRELAQAWSLELGSGDPCLTARRHQVQCFRTTRSTLALIRQLDRPGILTLRDAYNRAAFAMLGGLSADTATLVVDGVARPVPLLALADYWRGEFATFWRAPPDYSGVIVDRRSGPAANWLALQLAAARGDSRPVGAQFDDAALKGWIHTFQLTQGLPSDGVAGPVTLMQLNRAVGIDEPRLQTER
jgi:general secretion pathway protein A